MNALVVYFSKFGNAKMVADANAATLKTTASVRVRSLDQLTISDMQDVDLLVMGSPTHRMNLPEVVRPVLKGCRSGSYAARR